MFIKMIVDAFKSKHIPYKHILIAVHSPGEIATLKPVIESILKNTTIKITLVTNEKSIDLIKDRINDLLTFKSRFILEEITKKTNPSNFNHDFMITSLFHGVNQQYIEYSKQKGIPVVGIVDYVLPKYDAESIFYRTLLKLDRVVVTNGLTETNLKKLVDTKLTIKNGTDPKMHQASIMINEIKKSIELQVIKEKYYQKGSINICFSGQLIPNDTFQEKAFVALELAIEKIIKDNPNSKVNIIYLPHPRENDFLKKSNKSEYYKFRKIQEIFKSIKNVTTKYFCDDSYKGVAIADIHITETSTLGVESAYAGIPTLFITNSSHGIEALENGYIPYTDDPGKVCQYLINISSLSTTNVADKLKSDIYSYIVALGLIID